MFFFARRLGALAAAFACLSPLYAAEDGDAVIITATRTEQPVSENIAHTTVLTQKQIEESQIIDLPALLRQQAGVEFSQNGGIGHPSGLFMRGAATNQTLLLVDGVRISSLNFGYAQLDQLMLDQVERVEIVRGNLSSLYGSGAMGGVVQVFTKRNKGAPSGSVLAGYGTDDTSRFAASLGGNFNGLELNVTASHFETDGFSAIKPSVSPTVDPDDDGYRNTSTSFNARYAFNADHAAGLSYLETRGEADFDSAFALASTDKHSSKSEISAFRLFSENSLSDFWKSTLSYGEGRDRYQQEIRSMFPSNSFVKTINRNFGWQNEFSLTDEQSLIAGYENLRQYLDASDAIYPEDLRKVNSLYGGYRARFGDHQFEASGRNEDYSDFGSEFTYNVGYGYHLTEALKIVGSRSKGFRAPTFNELYFPFFGNPDLEPETAHTSELGLVFSQDVHLFRVAAFHTRYRDLISGLPVFPFTAVNIAKAEINGVEFSYGGKLFGIEMNANFTVQDPENEDTRERLVRRANHYGSLTLRKDFGSFDIGGEFVASGDRTDNDPLTFERVKLDGYGIVNLTARYRLHKDTYAGLRAENIFDRDYELASGYNTQGSALMFTLSYQPKP